MHYFLIVHYFREDGPLITISASKVPPPPKEQTNVAKYPLFINGTENTKLSLELYTTQLVASLSKESVISSEITGMNNHIKYDII